MEKLPVTALISRRKLSNSAEKKQISVESVDIFYGMCYDAGLNWKSLSKARYSTAG